MSQTIFRVANRQKPYSQLGNAMIRDGRLSWEARAVLAFILSFPSDWEFSLAWFCRETNTGRDKARRVVRELEAAGYCARERNRKPDGTLGAFAYVFTDEPSDIQVDRAPATEKASVVHVDEPAPENTTVGSPVTGQPALAKASVDKERDLTNKITKDRSPEKREDDFGPRPAVTARFVTEEALDRVRSLAPGWDRQFLLRKFMDWEGSRTAANLDAAFLGWVKSFTKGRPAS
jgi:hypothetical protein